MKNAEPRQVSRGRGFLSGYLSQRSAWMVPLIYLICGSAFVIDLLRDNAFAYGIVYTPLIVTSVFHKSRRSVWILVAIATTAVVLGAFIPVVNADLPDMIVNRVLSILAILATAVFLNYARDIQERLAAETRRAEAAERVKTDVFTNLSAEIRSPLVGILGLLGLLRASTKPDQAAALEQVQVDASELLRTIDNLIDLTQINERTLAKENVDVNALAQAAAAEAASLAREKSVSICVPDGGGRQVIGDSWAIRRIVSNLLTHQIRHSRPGETVSIIVKQNGRDVTTSITGPVAATLAEAVGDGLGAEAEEAWWVEGGADLALCHRLARGMEGRLLVAELAEDDAMFSLLLPAL
jgi:signal transduction histidine kinase